MSGSYDFPPATPADDPSTTIPTRLDLVRQALARGREIQAAGREYARVSARIRRGDQRGGAVSTEDRRLRERLGARITRLRRTAEEIERGHPEGVGVVPPGVAADGRQGNGAPQEYNVQSFGSRLRSLQEAEEALANLSSALEQADRSINLASSELAERENAFRGGRRLEGTLPSFATSFPPGDYRGRKRRKLDHESAGDAYPRIAYGYEGQVVAGRLRMEIASCDGGEYEDGFSSIEGIHNVENVLRKDKSVYCSKTSKCNILLRHEGEVPFSVERLVIKAPGRGFTAPVQEGMVFVSMQGEELLRRTSGYQINYNPAYHLPDSRQTSPAPTTPDTDDSSDETQPLDLTRPVEVQDSPWLQRPSTSHDDTPPPDDDSNNTSLFGDGTAPISDAEQFKVTIQSEDETSDADEAPNDAVQENLLMREGRWRSDSESDDEHIEFVTNNIVSRARAWRRSRVLRANRRSQPSKIATSDRTPDDSEAMAPHARFFIRKSRSTATIKFEPPVSGKYLLLKLWSPVEGMNIDVQNVLVYGFCGPRMFAACEAR